MPSARSRAVSKRPARSREHARANHASNAAGRSAFVALGTGSGADAMATAIPPKEFPPKGRAPTSAS